MAGPSFKPTSSLRNFWAGLTRTQLILFLLGFFLTAAAIVLAIASFGAFAAPIGLVALLATNATAAQLIPMVVAVVGILGLGLLIAAYRGPNPKEPTAMNEELATVKLTTNTAPADVEATALTTAALPGVTPPAPTELDASLADQAAAPTPAPATTESTPVKQTGLFARWVSAKKDTPAAKADEPASGKKSWLGNLFANKTAVPVISAAASTVVESSSSQAPDDAPSAAESPRDNRTASTASETPALTTNVRLVPSSDDAASAPADRTTSPSALFAHREVEVDSDHRPTGPTPDEDAEQPLLDIAVPHQ